MDKRELTAGRSWLANALLQGRRALRRDFFAGLLVIGPIASVGMVALGLVSWIGGKYERLPLLNAMPSLLRLMIGISLTLVVVVFIGFLARVYIGIKILEAGDRVIERIPFLRTIYQLVKMFLEMVMDPGTRSFREVVLIEYPKKDLLSLAFVVRRDGASLSREDRNPLVYLFIPKTPNPTTGFFLMTSATNLIPTDLTVEEAFKLVISAGIVLPDRLRQTISAKR